MLVNKDLKNVLCSVHASDISRHNVIKFHDALPLKPRLHVQAFIVLSRVSDENTSPARDEAFTWN